MGGGASTTFERKFLEVSFEDAYELVEPFDLIVFHGNTAIEEIIFGMEDICGGHHEWSHVAVVITPEVFPIKNGMPGRKYIWEGDDTKADKSIVPNIETGEASTNVQIRDLKSVWLEDICGTFKGTTVGIAKLKHNPWKESQHRPEYRQLLVSVATNLKERLSQIKFALTEHSGTILKRRAFQDYTHQFEDSRPYITDHLFTPQILASLPKTIFCSATVTVIYQAIGVFPLSIDPMLVIPADFATKRLKDTPLEVIQAPLLIDPKTVPLDELPPALPKQSQWKTQSSAEIDLSQNDVSTAN